MSVQAAQAGLDSIQQEKQRLLDEAAQIEADKAAMLDAPYDAGRLRDLNLRAAALALDVEEIGKRVVAATEVLLDAQARDAWEEHRLNTVFPLQQRLAEEKALCATVGADAKRFASSVDRLFQLRESIINETSKAFGWIPSGHQDKARPLVAFLATNFTWAKPYIDLLVSRDHPTAMTPLEDLLGQSLEDHLRQPTLEELHGFGLIPEIARRVVAMNIAGRQNSQTVVTSGPQVPPGDTEVNPNGAT